MHRTKHIVQTGTTLARNWSTTNARLSGKLEGKVAVVTASTDGIGFAIAKKLATDGAQVVISSRKEKNVLNAVEELKSAGLDVIGTVCHVGKEEDRRKLLSLAVEKFGGLDILVSNAAVNPFFGHILDCPEETWDKIFEINVKTAFLLFRDCVPLMKARGGGSAVFISSIGGYQPIPFLGPYSVSKTALLGLTKALATETAPDNIRVNCVAPGIIKTKFASALTDTESIAEKVLETVPLNR
ncbi:dehydrogenase/reductase SDR family member 4 [Eurytemora carolleeae]|uniref:dehydrogenase/reductase SDR family member 4 n=1 Tax=Eurytemora carolleeae TaxID=1294199 RepID=UPI000C7672BE|nr:dehydrogenase/reductase SDR family member 4 [Eurytemora carolleeae]|eukprot:XP_023330003.1 dehydrogenase/reductase SDR family member 4-like [Eurytemora affinis]